MKLLLDIGATQELSLPDSARSRVLGQLLTPLTLYKRWADVFAIDNGAFVMFKRERFRALLEREAEHKDKCLFVCVPDCVGSARRTREVWKYRDILVPGNWPLAYVCQDGSESVGIPWDDCKAVFIGGTTEWKMSDYAAQIVKTAKILGKHVHVGRINSNRRWRHFERLGVDTCDGSGVSRFTDRLLETIAGDDHPLFNLTAANAAGET